jgi:condensin complex subunit 2
MEDVLENQDVSGDNPNFQAASCALDASVKIYSCRVDSVHTDAFKVLGGLTRTGKKTCIPFSP